MLSFPGSLKVFVAVEPCDMRKGFNGLHAMASERLGEDPRQGALFVFINRRHNRLKILYFSWHRFVGDDQAVGRGHFLLAQVGRARHRQTLPSTGSLGHAHRWGGPQRSQVETLVRARKLTLRPAGKNI
jgi:transposase